tara:strand:+ start:9977 stop:10366 length:390 start_codon:yes stop_codon:yes gene_type:complete
VNEPSIAAVDAKIDNLVHIVDKLADTVSNLNTVHTEINHLSEKVTKCENNFDSINKDLRLVSDKVITNSIQADEYRYIKKIFISFMITAFIGGGYMTKTTIDNSSRQASAMAEIVKAIKEGSTKINKGK